MDLHQDFSDLLSALAASNADYLVVGGWAVAFHAEPRFTKDLDVWIGTDPSNLERVAEALVTFGAPTSIVETLRGLRPDEFLFLGVEPTRVDFLRKIDGVDFEAAFARRCVAQWDGISVSIIDRDDLIAAKRAAGRPRDLQDIQRLGKRR